MDESEGLFNILQKDLELGELLGSGCFGHVYKGIWRSDDEELIVAIKRMKVNKEFPVGEIYKEFKTMQIVQFENICKVYGASLVNNDEVWLVMEFVEGGDLHTFLQKFEGPLPKDLQLSFCIQATKALASLHDAPTPILHRDIKSHNYLVQNKSKLLLTDFGISKAKSLVNTNTFTIGTVNWAAPEIVTKKPQWSEKADIYSLGMVFYEIITRQIPYHEDKSLVSILDKIKSGKLPRIPVDCSKDIARIILQCWHPKPQKRPNTSELLHSLEGILQLKDHKTSPTLSPVPSRARRQTNLANDHMTYKIAVVGAPESNKSDLTVRFVTGTFLQRYDPTIEDSYRKQVEIDGKACILDIVDTAAQEEYHAIRDVYLTTADGIVLVYSITSSNGLDGASKLLENIYRIIGLPYIPIMLVGNNCHEENERKVSTEDGRKLAEQWSIAFMEASAKTPKNVNEVFVGMVRIIYNFREAHQQQVPRQNNASKKAGCEVM